MAQILGVRRVAFVLKGYPRLSETFIAEEILGLEKKGLDILIVSLRRPNEKLLHPVHRLIRASLLYLPEYLYREPRRLWRSWRRARRLPFYRRARRLWLADLRRDPSPNRVRRFGQALVLAAELPREIGHLHAHFLHTPASVARYAAAMLGLSWSVSAHAKDVWTLAPWEARRKLADAAWAVTCNAAARARLLSFAPPSSRLLLARHGIDFARFPPSPLRPRESDGGNPEDPVILLSVGRAVKKKGYEDLLDALALLPQDLSWRFVHIGGGVLAKKLARRGRRLFLDRRIEWRGPCSQPEVLAAYRQAQVFVLASKIAPDGDRDGLPNVLVEAQSQGLPCVATALSGIPELIEDGVSGLLVRPGKPALLAAAIESLIRDPLLRNRLGVAAEVQVRRSFDARATIETLVLYFKEPLPEALCAAE